MRLVEVKVRTKVRVKGRSLFSSRRCCMKSKEEMDLRWCTSLCDQDVVPRTVTLKRGFQTDWAFHETCRRQEVEEEALPCISSLNETSRRGTQYREEEGSRLDINVSCR